MDDLDNLDDIEMLNTNDFLTSNSVKPSIDSPLDSSSSTKSDSLDDSFIIDSDTKTPGEILDEFCMKLEDINTTMPDQVINHYMKKAGFIVNDPKLVKIISIASQKFISEIVNDVMQHHKLKTKSASSQSASASAAPNAAAGSSKVAPSEKSTKGAAAAAAASAAATSAAAAAAQANAAGNVPLTLTLEDLSQVLETYGINVKKPYYFM